MNIVSKNGVPPKTTSMSQLGKFISVRTRILLNRSPKSAKEGTNVQELGQAIEGAVEQQIRKTNPTNASLAERVPIVACGMRFPDEPKRSMNCGC
jgi:hypothetical protein